MEEMYQTYKDVAEFRLIYIREAHAADGRRPVKYAIEKGINEHTSHADRCKTAEILLKEKTLNIPMLIDELDNKVGEAYSAWPDRVFLVRKDGTLAVAADRGPWGFKPGLDAAEEFLAKFKKTGKEPDTPAAERADSDSKSKTPDESP